MIRHTENKRQSYPLFKNYVKVAVRNLARDKGQAFINLFGLAVGMTCCILIFLYIQDELSYDRYPDKAGQTYRLALEAQTPDRGVINTARTPPPWAPALAKEFPEVESTVRIKTPLVSWNVGYIAGEKRFHEKGFYFADPSVFDVFSFKLVKGDPNTALKDPRTLVMTETAARKYFGDADPIGKTIRVDNTYDFRVTGVMQDVPRNSHITFDILASFESLNVLPIYVQGARYDSFQATGLFPDVYTYLRLQKGYSPSAFEKKMPDFLRKYVGGQIAQFRIQMRPFLQPLTRIHLHSNLDAEMKANSNVSYIYIFSAIAAFVLLIACINFMNLATARSAGRAQEVGLRKVVGAYRGQLVQQFLGETLFLSGLALALALLFTSLLLRVFNNLSGKKLSLMLAAGWGIPIMIGLTVLVGLIAGSYPAFFLSAFRPANVLKGSLKSSQGSALFRRVLVVFQFAVSIVFMIGTGLVYRQLDYIQNKPLGFDKENVVVLPLGDPRARVVYQSFKDRVLQSPDVVAVAGVSDLPGGLTNIAFVRPEGAAPGEQVTMEAVFVDHDFIKALGIELAAGRNFSRDFPTDTLQAFILNETAVKLLGWEAKPIDRQISLGNLNGRVIGVVKDFHLKSLHNRIGAVFLHLPPQTPDPLHYLAVKIRPGSSGRTLKFIEEKWREVYPQDPFIYSFLKDDFDGLYRTEQRRGGIFLAFSVLTILIACLGLLGLASFTAEQRNKEIGIRKVLGASVPTLVRLLSKEFVQLVLLANLAAWPIAYFAMRGWLRNFAYRVSIGWGIFFAAAISAVAIALLTVSYQAVKAALANPIDAIHRE